MNGETPHLAAQFERSMRAFAPFEANPCLAVAVSGGPDSMALALLAADWVHRQGGDLLALTLDHGLRAGSAAEALRTAQWLRNRGIATEVLEWRRELPLTSGVQARARAARYRILAERCAALGILHLLLAHQAEDQSETFVLRLLRDSGFEGLAGMSAIVELPYVRLLRPLLGSRRLEILNYLRSKEQGWIDDPSNQDIRFARAALRSRGLPASHESIVKAGAHLTDLRRAFEERLTGLISEHVEIDPLGAANIEPVFGRLPFRFALALLGRVVATIGGTPYLPRGEPLGRALEALRSAEGGPPKGTGRDRTLGRCRILWRSGKWVVVRNPSGIRDPNQAYDIGPWDGRYRLVGVDKAHPLGATAVARKMRKCRRFAAIAGFPVLAAGLPGSEGQVLAFPDLPIAADIEPEAPRAHFRPLRPLAPAVFFSCFADRTGQM